MRKEVHKTVAKQYYAVQQVGKTAELYIFGDIVPLELFENDVSAHGVVEQIKELDADVINVHIDSYGGAVSEGWAIYNTLKAHPAKINSYADGFVASAALYPFMAGDNRYASTLSAFYFHQVMITASGYAEDLRAAADEAEMMTEIGINAFTDSTGMNADEVRELQKLETWLSPEEALKKGVVTAILDNDSQKYAQHAKKKLLQLVFQERQKSIVTVHPPTIMQILAGNFTSKNKEE